MNGFTNVLAPEASGIQSSLSQSFAAHIRRLPDLPKYTQSDLLTDPFRLGIDGNLTVYYAPFDFVNCAAKVAIVGITPGWQQMEIAFRVARRELNRGATPEEANRQAKMTGSFAGSMRRNLLSMLDELNLPEILGIRAAEDLFTTSTELLHTSSVFRYPVLRDGSNYTGSNPTAVNSRLLMNIAWTVFASELRQLENAVIIPLGKTASDVLRVLIEKDHVISPDRCLFGFPHPSGANGHRRAEFHANKTQLRQTLKSAFIDRS